MGLSKTEYAMLSSLEKKVVDWLIKYNIPFASQVPMFGGSMELGGATADIVLVERNIILRVFGGYWHKTLEANARDELGKERLMAKGYIVVDLWEENLTDERIDHTMRLALRGEEVPR